MTRGKPKDGSKNPGGRPEKWTEKALIEMGDRLIDWLNQSPKNIFFQEFLNEVGLYEDWVSDYREKYKSFSDLIKKAKSIEKQKIIKYACIGKLNTAMSIFVLKNNFQMSDKVENYNKHEGSIIVTKSIFDKK